MSEPKDNLSDLFKGEVDSVRSYGTSTDSLQLITDEFHLRHLSTPDVSNIELSKRVALLELENERLRVDLENLQIELSARIAANQGLKGKVTELYVEIQSAFQQKQQLQNSLTDVKNRLSTAETSAKWYQSQVHNLQASRKALQAEIHTYQCILKQRQQAMLHVTEKYKQLNTEYIDVMHRQQKEKQNLQDEIKNLKMLSYDTCKPLDLGIPILSPDLSIKLEAAEEELRDTKTELKMLEQRLLGNEVAKMSMENILSKQRILISSMEETIQKCEVEKSETSERLCSARLEIQKLRTENEDLQTALTFSKQEQSQIEGAIVQLRSQLSKMIAQYKLLKDKNAESDERLTAMQGLINENKMLKKLSHERNSLLLKKLRQQRQKIKDIEAKLYEEKMMGHFNETKKKTDIMLQECLKQVLLRSKDIQEQSKLKLFDESIDEGYGDNSTLSSVSTDVPSPVIINPILLSAATDVLAKSKDFLLPVHMQLNKLQSKLENFRESYGLTGKQNVLSV